MKLLSTTPKSVSSYAMLKNLERFKIPPMTESWVRQQGHRPLLFLKEKEAKSGHVKLMSRNIPVSSVCFSSTLQHLVTPPSQWTQWPVLWSQAWSSWAGSAWASSCCRCTSCRGPASHRPQPQVSGTPALNEYVHRRKQTEHVHVHVRFTLYTHY